MKDILIEWIQKGLQLNEGDEIYIPTAHKDSQKDFFKELRDEVKAYRKLDPVQGSQLRVAMTYKDKKYWVVMKKVPMTPLVGFLKTADGRISKVTIGDKEQERIEKLKKRDGGV